ncbi:phage major capsid protein [Sphingosinicella sp. LY1275]|uniref:phage major capsid protein n=1 Tax=Sphingosinicella sp. LY1275 TaxID=3095379 RepID=UPI002ADEE805|nr:phage major capsid protein [Sphingosinicella sp. LY1275]MEA1015593.1 phage major capsid protein [Sphingosinicella sp. LY1275]
MEMKDILKEHTDAVEKQLGALDEKTRSAVQEVMAAKARLNELEQKVARRGGPSEPENQSWGEQVAEKSAELANLSGGLGGKAQFQMKTTITTASGSGGDLVAATRDATVQMPQRRLIIRDLLPVIRVSSGSVEYPKQTGRTNAANTVAEGTAKPESGYTYDLEQVPIRTIAHWVPASRQVLEDVPQLQGIIDSELRYGLALKEEAQLISGDGQGQNLGGLITEAAAYAPSITVPTPTRVDVLAVAMLQVALADFNPDGIVLHPSDWIRIRLLKDADGNYIMGPPAADVLPRLFGLPVVPTTGIAAGTFLVGNFQVAATIYDRWEARVEVSTEHANFFTENKVAILAEERIGLAVKQPLALAAGSFASAITATTES